MTAAALPGLSRRALVRRAIALAALAPALTYARGTAAAPAAELWRRWTAHDPASTRSIDHSVWNRLVGTYRVDASDGIARVAYAQMKSLDLPALARYIDQLAAVPISAYRRDEQRAFWFNLYNALTIKVVLDHYPVRSIRDIDISPGLFASGPWGKKLIAIEGEPVSLDDMEHRILRPIWGDPRTHYGVNCASLGCPNLPPQAFSAANTDNLLAAGARDYVNHPRGARIDRGRLFVSSIYVWFQDDFGDSDKGVIAHLRRYAAEPLANGLADIGRIAGHDYDWSLNDAQSLRR